MIYSSLGLGAATISGDSAVCHDGKAGAVTRGGSPTSDKSNDLLLLVYHKGKKKAIKDRLIYSSPGLDAATISGDGAVCHDGKAGAVHRGGTPTSDKSSGLLFLV